MEKKKITMAYDCELKKPGCALLQAAMGGDRGALAKYFRSEDWLLAPTPGMRLIAGTEDEWEKAARITAACRKKD